MKKLIVVFVSVLALAACGTHPQTSKSQIFKNSAEQVKSSSFARRQACPAIGAIRWDAWYGTKDDIGKAVVRSLSPRHWQYRLPFCAQVTGENVAQINCASKEVMDKEIAYAKRAGIDYWAFVVYEEDSGMSLGLQNYLSSAKKSEVNFSLITTFGRIWSPKNYKAGTDRIIKLMHEPSYQKVAGGRPLLFIGFIHNNSLGVAFRKSLIEFRQRAQNEGLGKPYIVIMDSDPNRAQKLADDLGFDAISSYAIPGSQKIHPFKELATNAEHYWNQAKGINAQIVPTVMSGWDPRPRVENPVPWAKKEGDIEKYYEPPTPVELGQHLATALSWMRYDPIHTQANSLIIYAWNENDEGGWLVPTLSEGTARIDALGSVIRRDCPTK